MISILRRPTSDFCHSVLVLGPLSSAVCRGPPLFWLLARHSPVDADTCKACSRVLA